MIPQLRMKPGLIERTQELRGLLTDRAMAGAIGVSVMELMSVRNGGAPSQAFIAGFGDAFGFTVGEMAELYVPQSQPEKAAA